MDETVRHPKNSATHPWRKLALPGFVLVCWFLAGRHLASQWTLNPQYHYGWTVPLLALYLIRMRLESTPDQRPMRWPWTITAGVLVVALAEVLLLPLQEANADWRLMGWLLTALAAAATLLLFTQLGGLPWLGHFAFPALFVFTAVPWPRPIEIDVMQWLMQHNAQIAAELLRWVGVAAEVQGNLIRLSSGTVGVDEACSGIRSLQGSLMATLFVGEIFGLSLWRRVILLVAGAGWALVTNVGRTLFLAWMTEQGGPEALERWHDSAGLWVLGASVAGVTLSGWLLRQTKNRRTTKSNIKSGDSTLADGVGHLSPQAGAAVFGMMLILLGWGATEAWFRMKEASVVQVADWSFTQPAEAADFAFVEQSGSVRGELRYQFHSGGRWRDAEGRYWVAHYFRWDPGSNSVRGVMVHDPRVCLSATGKELVSALPPVTHRTGEIVLSFDAYWFREQGQDVFVFNCLAEDVRRGPGEKPERSWVTMSSRLEAVRAGKRHLGQRRLEVAVWGARDAAEAREAFEALLREKLTVKS